MNKREVIRTIALTLAEQDGAIAPSVTHWGQAAVWADLFEMRGHLNEQPKPLTEVHTEAELAALKTAPAVENIYGYVVVGRDGSLADADLLTQQDAIDVADKWTKDAQQTGVDWDYSAAAVVKLEA